MWESSSLLTLLTCSVLHVKSRLSHQHILNQLETAVMDSTYSMHQLEILGPSLMLKLLVTDLWTLLWSVKFIHPMWESSSLLTLLTCSVLHVKSHLSHQHILNQLEIAVLDSTHSMCQLEILGASLLLKLLVSDLLVTEVLGPSLMLKLLVTDLWTLLWNIKFMHLMWESSSLLTLLTCSVLHVKSHLSRQHILSQLETAALDSTYSMHQLEILGAS